MYKYNLGEKVFVIDDHSFKPKIVNANIIGGYKDLVGNSIYQLDVFPDRSFYEKSVFSNTEDLITSLKSTIT